MPTHKIGPPPSVGWQTSQVRCTHPEHNPPMYHNFEPGLYEHVCPKCGHRIEFVVEESDYYKKGGE